MPTPILTTDHPRQQCVDLRAMYAKRYRMGYDPAYEHERSDFRAQERAWLTLTRISHSVYTTKPPRPA